MNSENHLIKFIQIGDNAYVLNKGNSNSKYGLNIFTTCYTPTHIITYPNGDPNDFRDIKEINYTKSKVSFYKDYNSNKCCIDIYDDISNPNKCRIIGQNGQTILYTDKNYSFDMYEVSQESNSFFDNKPRLIYVNRNGLYIVSKKENTIENYIKNHKFKGEVIEVSALDGQCKASGFDKSKEIFIFNCPSNTPLLFKVEPTPIMKQIEKITFVTPPLSNQTASQHMVISHEFQKEQMGLVSNEWFINEDLFDNPEDAKNRLKEIGHKRWDN